MAQTSGVHQGSLFLSRFCSFLLLIAACGCGGGGSSPISQPPQPVTAVPPGPGIESINHIIFMAQENRSFDHYFGHLDDYRTAPPYNLPADVDGTPANASNPSADGTTVVTPFLMQSVCVENQSPSWNESHTQYNRQD